MNLTQIVTTDPDARGYASMSDADIEADIKDKRHSQRKRVPLTIFAQALIDIGVMQAVVTAELDATSPANATAKLVQSMLDNVQKYGVEAIDMDKAGNDALFDAMQTAGLMDASQRATLEALADEPASLSDLNELSSFTHLDIAKITGGGN